MSTTPKQLRIINGIPAVQYTSQTLTEEQKAQARENISIDEAVLKTLVTLDLAPVLLDSDGAVLIDDNGAILLNESGLDDKTIAAIESALVKALSEAKESGEFDGADGKDGTNGNDGTSVSISSVSESTEDGGSNVVTFSDGKTLTVKNGKTGAAGKDGSNGADGKTPVKGTDYYTDADKTELVNLVLAALPTWTGGSY